MESGATVHILDQDDTKLAEAKSAYPSITTINADLMDWESTQNKIKEHGPFHHLVNNAGIVRPWEYLLDIKSDSVDQLVL
jgi:short-subunit dehydrogenase involved in D-alanine esterification of teichoic acids